MDCPTHETHEINCPTNINDFTVVHSVTCYNLSPCRVFADCELLFFKPLNVNSMVCFAFSSKTELNDAINFMCYRHQDIILPL